MQHWHAGPYTALRYVKCARHILSRPLQPTATRKTFQCAGSQRNWPSYEISSLLNWMCIKYKPIYIIYVCVRDRQLFFFKLYITFNVCQGFVLALYAFHLWPYAYVHAPCSVYYDGKQFLHVWLQKLRLTQEHRFGSQSSKQFHTFLPG